MRGVGLQPEMDQDVLTHVRLGNKGDDAHGSGTAWTLLTKDTTRRELSS